MRILEFSDSHPKGTRCPNTEALIDVTTEEKPDLLIGNGDVIDLWAEKEEVIAQNPIGHDHAFGSLVPEYKPQLWNGRSILDEGTYLVVTDGVPELKRV